MKYYLDNKMYIQNLRTLYIYIIKGIHLHIIVIISKVYNLNNIDHIHKIISLLVFHNFQNNHQHNDILIYKDIHLNIHYNI